jgi:hypothetical protein
VEYLDQTQRFPNLAEVLVHLGLISLDSNRKILNSYQMMMELVKVKSLKDLICSILITQEHTLHLQKTTQAGLGKVRRANRDMWKLVSRRKEENSLKKP